MNTKHVFKTLITIVVISLGSTQSAFSAESSISEADWILTGDSPLLDRELIEINRDAQTALNQTRQMIVAELTENVEALYQDATRTMAYHDVVLVKIADAN